MSLREILSRMADDGGEIRLADQSGCYGPRELLDSLSAARLAVRSHYQPGLYIARIDEAGYLGAVLYRVKK
ncbi:MAG: hypothetical protein JXA62_05285 [Candidatus Aminicenantes bacterium]|nr:hypothetical protein [Candidatus Aminicenantes bacterium]